MTFYLFSDSNTQVQLFPDYDYKADVKKIENRHRTRSGDEYVYQWSTFKRYDFSVDYVNSADASQINSWYQDNTDLRFTVDSFTNVNTVRLKNSSMPLSGFVKPYDDQFKGRIILEGY